MRVVSRLDHNHITIPPGAKPGDCIGVIIGIAENRTSKTLYGGFKYVPNNPNWEEVSGRSMNHPAGTPTPIGVRVGWRVVIGVKGQPVLRSYEVSK